MFIEILFLILFFVSMVAVGFYYRKKAASVEGFVLGSRGAGPWLTAFAFGTSYFSAVIFVGYAGQFGWNFGISSTWIGLGNAFIGSLLPWLILGRRTRIMTNHLNSKTMPEYFEARYDSKGLKLLSAVIVFVFLIPYTASLYNGLSRLFSMAFPGVNYTVCIVIMSVLTCVYVLLGGYMATAMNDFIQGIFMLGGIVAVIIAVLNQNGGFSKSVEKLAVNSGWEYSSFFGPDFLFLSFVVVLTSLGTWGLPQMVGKFYAIKDEESIKTGTVISSIFAVVVAGGCYFLGGFSRLFADVDPASGKLPMMNGEVVSYDRLVPGMLENLGPVIIGIVLVLVLSASMSTLSSLVLTSGSTVTLDLIAPLRKKQVSEKGKMLLMRFLIVFFVAISALIAIYQVNAQSGSSVTFIANLMGVSWGALAGAFIGPFLWGLYFKKTTRAAVYVSFAMGVCISLLQLIKSLAGFSFGISFFDDLFFKTSIHSGAFAMVLSLILVPLISLFTKKQSDERIEEIFSCYNRTVTVKATDVLKLEDNN
ncbi:MAG: sodium:solute symporter [Clostridia bacterium]|nr:sodium:solute symporter [Clostridia bacterium]